MTPLLLEKTISRPLGDQEANHDSAESALPSVNWRAGPPPRGRTQTSRLPLRCEWNTSSLPSGDHMGPTSGVGSLVNWIISPVDIVRIQRSRFPLRSELKARRLPSGHTSKCFPEAC